MIYTGQNLKEILFPLGGMGTGSIGLAGNGMLRDWEIFNRPNKGSTNGYSHLAVTARTGDRKTVKMLHTDVTKDLMGQYSGAGSGQYYGYGFGPLNSTMCGFPHFRDCVFRGEFPIAELTFSDSDFPGHVTLTAFNPLIPLNADDSGLPAAFFCLTFENPTDQAVTFGGVLSVTNPFKVTENEKTEIETPAGRYPAVFLRHAGAAPHLPDYGDMTLVCLDDRQSGAQAYWYRGGWQDSVVMYYRELCRPEGLSDRRYDVPGKHDTGSVFGEVTVPAHGAKSLRFLLTWNVPNCYNYWNPCRDDEGRDITWKNHYATRFADSRATAAYCAAQFDRLYRETDRFRRDMFAQTLDPAVIDAAASSLSVLKTATVLRLENGAFYGWEGQHEKGGSCEGTCQHVWNYAYALCFLFPELERSIRDLELMYCLKPSGQSVFRLKLPLGRDAGDHRACVDGQMGTVIKIYREWKLSGDDAWLRGHWENVKKLIAYAWSDQNPDGWDRDRDGVLEGRQHHTLDMELFGPSSWLEGFYLAALKAGAEMAAYLGDREACEDYLRLYQSGRDWSDRHLFNGSYFCQQIDLKDKSVTDRFDASSVYWNEETGEIKYQIGEGCEIDQLCADWHAALCGLGEIFDGEHRRTALASLFANNFKPSLRNFVNPWRVFALNDEAAAIMCDYPGDTVKPAIPLPYCEEAMTGFEYQLAGSLIAAGLCEEGLTVCRAVRARYNGANRNPYNEIECGSNYARSMAAFALIPLFSGFVFDLPHGLIGFVPRVEGNFRGLFSLSTGWGVFERRGNRNAVTLRDGTLPLRALRVEGKPVRSLTLDGQPTDFTREGDTLHFVPHTLRHEAVWE